MITLKEAIELATLAHQNQWRKAVDATIEEYEMPRKETLIHGEDYILENGKHLFEENGIFRIDEPYITHPLAVMEMMSTDEEKIIAVLHDAIEDTDYILHPRLKAVYTCGHPGYWICRDKNSIDTAIDGRLNGKMWESLHILTKSRDQSYLEYIGAISNNKIATKIKIADITHNLSDNPSEHAKAKYLKAMPILLKAL